MSFTSGQLKELKSAATRMQVEYAALLALCEVETGSQVFAKVNGKDEPLIRWEGHYFNRLVPPKKLKQAQAAGLANPKAGAVKNPATQTKRYDMLERGKAFDYEAAVSSCSWGFGQIMGSHWKSLGYASAAEFEKSVRKDFSGQLQAFTFFLSKSGIIPHLQRKDWAAVARIYNGPNYAKGGYHTKMKDAYERQVGKASSPSSSGMLRSGSKGQDVRELQMLLRGAGYDIKVDGDFGPATERAVKNFQRDKVLDVDGVVGPRTMVALENYRSTVDAQPGKSVPSKVKEVREGSTGLVVTGLFTALRDQFTEAAQQLTGIGNGTAETLSNGLLAGASIIGIGLTVYAIAGYLRSKKTYRGIEENA